MYSKFILTMLAVVFASIIAPSAQATLIGTVVTNPGDTVVPGLVAPGTDPGTLLASLSAPFISSLGDTSGTLVSAVYREAGGTLDFYYQVNNNTTAPNCGGAGQPGCDAITRETDTSFIGFLTYLGIRLDGGSLPGPFVNGSIGPVSGDRNAVGNVVGFGFTPPQSAAIQPGQSSYVLVISTNATSFTTGNSSVSDGGVTTVSSFQPAGTPDVPEPATFLLLGGGLVALGSVRRFLV